MSFIKVKNINNATAVFESKFQNVVIIITVRVNIKCIRSFHMSKISTSREIPEFKFTIQMSQGTNKRQLRMKYAKCQIHPNDSNGRRKPKDS